MQARHLWAFSTLLMAQPESWGFNSKDVRAAADTAYTFMRDKMMRDVKGGEQGTAVWGCHATRGLLNTWGGILEGQYKVRWVIMSGCRGVERPG